MKITLSGHPWHALSPSRYRLASHPITLFFDGEAWYLAFEGHTDGARPWPSRDAAAGAIAQAFLEHQLQEQGLI